VRPLPVKLLGRMAMSAKEYKRKRNVMSGKARMLSVQRIAKEYGFSVHTVYNWVNRDHLRHVKHGPGGKIFIRQDDVERFINQWYETEEE